MIDIDTVADTDLPGAQRRGGAAGIPPEPCRHPSIFSARRAWSLPLALHLFAALLTVREAEFRF